MRRLLSGLMVGGLALALVPAKALWAQDDSPAKKITVIPDPVVLSVVVRDKKGAFVPGLTKDDRRGEGRYDDARGL